MNNQIALKDTLRKTKKVVFKGLIIKVLKLSAQVNLHLRKLFFDRLTGISCYVII